jgi:hypothetical protein
LSSFFAAWWDVGIELGFNQIFFLITCIHHVLSHSLAYVHRVYGLKAIANIGLGIGFKV